MYIVFILLFCFIFLLNVLVAYTVTSLAIALCTCNFIFLPIWFVLRSVLFIAYYILFTISRSFFSSQSLDFLPECGVSTVLLSLEIEVLFKLSSNIVCVLSVWIFVFFQLLPESIFYLHMIYDTEFDVLQDTTFPFIISSRLLLYSQHICLCFFLF